jgi:hypothetical protein
VGEILRIDAPREAARLLLRGTCCLPEASSDDNIALAEGALASHLAELKAASSLTDRHPDLAPCGRALAAVRKEQQRRAAKS